jgi:hypothetical protein
LDSFWRFSLTISGRWAKTGGSLSVSAWRMSRALGQVLAPDHVADRHVQVVDRVGQEEDRRAIGAEDDEVLQVGVLEGDVAPDEVADDGLAIVRRAEAQDALGQAAVAAEAVVAGRGVVLGAGLDLLPGARAVVGVARLVQAGSRLPVVAGPLRLAVRALVPVDAEPAQRSLDAIDQLVAGQGGIGVLDAQDERPPVVAGVEPVEQGRAGAADVEEAGRRGRETDPGWHAGHGSLGLPWPKRY